MSSVSKMYPRGIQFRKRRRVLSVSSNRLDFVALVSTSMHSWNTSENSPQSWFFRSLTF